MIQFKKFNPNLYISISESIGKLKSEGYDGVEAKDQGIPGNNHMTQLTSLLLLKIRLEKAKTNGINDYTNLLDDRKIHLKC